MSTRRKASERTLKTEQKHVRIIWILDRKKESRRHEVV